MTTTTMPPPPPKPPAEEPATSSTSTTTTGLNPKPISENPSVDTQQQDQSNSVTQHGSVPYKIPEWSGPPCYKFYFEVLKDGSIVDRFDVCKKGAYMFGRVDLCDIVLEHPTISDFHAVIQFKRSGDAYLYDVGSTHGTFINKNQVQKRVYVDLHVGDVIRFGQSSQLYIFQGPSDLMQPEMDLKIIRESKIQQEMLDQENSLRRARVDASIADGISWGVGEDAIEEAEDGIDEETWQTYKGQLTEKQEKTREGTEKLLNESLLIITGKEEAESKAGDELAESLNSLFTSISTMVKSELQGTTNTLELLEKMNLRVADEYKGFGDVASGLRVYVEQLKSKSGSFDEYVQQIDAIEQQVTQFEAVISMLDKYVSLLESKMLSVYQHQHQHPPSSS